MFDNQPSLIDRLSMVFKRYTQPVVPYNHLGRTFLIAPLWIAGQIGEIEQKNFDNGAIVVDNFSDGENFKYDISYKNGEEIYENHFYFRLLNDQEVQEKMKLLEASGKNMDDYTPDYVRQNTVVVTSIMLDNEIQDVKSPQEIYALANYMGNVFTRNNRGTLHHSKDKTWLTGKRRKFMDRTAFMLKRGL